MPERDAVEPSAGGWEGVAGSNLHKVAGQEEVMDLARVTPVDCAESGSGGAVCMETSLKFCPLKLFTSPSTRGKRRQR